MTLLNKIRRYAKNGNAYLVYCVIACLVFYLVVASSLNLQKHSNNEINEQYTKMEELQKNIQERVKKKVFDNENEVDFEQFLESDTFTFRPTQNLPCNPNSIPPKHEVPKEDISCIPHKSSQHACDYASRLYWRDEHLKTCGTRNINRGVEICTFSKVKKNGKYEIVYKCSFKDCERFHENQVTVLKFDPTEHRVTQHNSYTNEKTLEDELPDITKTSFKSGYSFLFLECGEYNEKISYNSLSQLLIIPLLQKKKKNKWKKRFQKSDKTKTTPPINVNLILLDSTSRSHFYRSLPNTLNAFTNINQNTTTEVLDFELFQAMEGHTAENIHALFTGTLFPKHFTGNDRESSPVGIGEFLKHYKSQDYYTIYHDDLCFEEWWGLRLDLGGPQTWNEYLERLEENYIDQTGISFASCRILSQNNVTNPFNGPDGPLCFNGKFHDSYHFDFLQMYHEHASIHEVALFSYTELNVGHDHTGRRIQSIDDDLSDFVTKISQLPNTLTILFADHGNTYTQYTHAVMEGRFEQYHPALFFIVPENVQVKLGQNIMENLRRNTKKIVTLLDVHESLVSVPTEPKEEGIFGTISHNRSCDDLDLRLPNLCVCEGWDAETLNDTSQIGVLDFAVGELNNKIMDFQQKIRDNGSITNCMRLVPNRFYNIRERNNQGRLVTSLTFTTNPGEGAPQTEDVFYVQLESNIDPEKDSRDMKILSFDRLSRYGPYSHCADKGADLKLCVCNIEPKSRYKNIRDLIYSDLMARPQVVTTDIVVKLISKLSSCLYYKTISHPELSDDQEEEEDNIFSSSYEVANICDTNLSVTLLLSQDNMKIADRSPLTKVVPPFSVRYMTTAIRAVPYWTSRVEKIEFIILKESPPIEADENDIEP